MLKSPIVNLTNIVNIKVCANTGYFIEEIDHGGYYVQFISPLSYVEHDISNFDEIDFEGMIYFEYLGFRFKVFVHTMGLFEDETKDPVEYYIRLFNRDSKSKKKVDKATFRMVQKQIEKIKNNSATSEILNINSLSETDKYFDFVKDLCLTCSYYKCHKECYPCNSCNNGVGNKILESKWEMHTHLKNRLNTIK